ncbi:MAG: hypothetical protein K2X72_23020 [Reyranella sp.]|nr:hypothetical protein [Reyranella sp.]
MSYVNSKVTPSLHPENVRQIDGYDDDTASLLAGTVAAFATAYEGVGAVWTAKDVVNQNSAWTDERKIIELSKHAQRQFDTIAKRFDSTASLLSKQIAHIEGELTAPVESKAALSISREIREHVKGLSSDQRMTFLERAITDGDATSLTALLGAPAYLSGMNAEMKAIYVRRYRERLEPVKAKRLKALNAARELIIERGALVFKELEKAVGATPQKAAALRKAHQAALDSLGLK